MPPSDSTFFRVISRLDAAQFELVAGSWLLEQEVSVRARLAVDGKVLRGCWQVIAMQRERAWLGLPPKPARVEIGYYATSLSQPQQDDPDSRAPQRPVKAGPRGAGTRFAKQPRRAAARLSLVQTALVGNAAPRLILMK